jgi:hypothetical protein
LKVHNLKLLTLQQASCRQTDTVYGASAFAAALVSFCAFIIATATGYLVIYGRIASFDPPRAISTGIALFFLLFAYMFARSCKAARRPTNWVMRTRGNDVLIKFRSYENWRLSEDDVQVIQLQRSEITSVRKVARKQLTQGTNPGPNSHSAIEVDPRVDLEIELKSHDTSALEKALMQERTTPGWGGEHHRTKVLDYPVQAENGIIRIAWRNKSTLVRPKIKKALADLGRIVQVAETKKETADFTPATLQKLPPEDQRKKLKELAELDPLAATFTAKRLYECSMTEADWIVKELLAADAETPTPPVKTGPDYMEHD